MLNGTILVALGEGALIGAGSAIAGVTRPVLFTLMTIAFAATARRRVHLQHRRAVPLVVSTAVMLVGDILYGRI